MVKRTTTTLIDSVFKRFESIGSNVDVMGKFGQDVDRIFAELKALSDDLAVVEAGGGFMLSGARMTAGTVGVANATPTIVPHATKIFDDATWVNLGADNTIITIPAGITRVNVLAGFGGGGGWAANAVGDREHELLKNGSEVVALVQFCATSGGSVSFTPITAGAINVVPGDTFSHRITQTSGGSLNAFGLFLSAFAL